MKKLIAMLMICLMLLGLCACGAKEEPVETVKIDAQPKVEMTTPIENVDPTTEAEPTEEETVAADPAAEKKTLAESCIDKDVSELYALIGEPESSEYAPSCLVEGGEDGMLYYDGFVVYTTREGDEESVYYVE
jgi:hypothetical protein